MAKAICAVDGCERTARSVGWCNMHHQRYARNGHFDLLLQPAAGLTCSTKECDRPAFSRGWCRLHYQRWRRERVGKSEHLRRTYGLTEDEYDALLASQDSRCAVCRRESDRLVVDHCHDSGRVRGILCGQCNLALGLVRDDPEVLAGLIAYLESHSARGHR